MPASGIEPRPAAWQATTLTVVPQQSVIGGGEKHRVPLFLFQLVKGKQQQQQNWECPNFKF